MIVSQKNAANIFRGGGEMGALMRSLDWSKTPLGAAENWSQSLKSAVSFLLPSKAQICLFWGAEFVILYNDAYSVVLGSKHPHVLGTPGWVCWEEIWEDTIGPLLNEVVATGDAFWAQDYPFFLLRHGFAEETYFDVSYDPIRDETGDVGGVFCIVNETTKRVLSERRFKTLHSLGAHSGQGKTVAEACLMAAEVLAENPADVPFALIYLLDETGKQATLAGSSGVAPNADIAAQTLALASETRWRLAEVMQSEQPVLMEPLSTRFRDVPPGTWIEPPHTALILPIASAGYTRTVGFLIAGVSARLALDDAYRNFFELVVGHIATAVASARVYEEERQRAEALAELDRAKTEFFSNVSHEFRTPLTLMLNPLQDTLKDTALSPQQRENLQVIHRNSLRLLKLVNTLLDFSRIQANRIEAVFEPTDLATLTIDLASNFRSAIERGGLALLVKCPPLSEPIYVDQEMWEKIVLNLISNAFKHTFMGGIAVRLSESAEHVTLLVSDTGIGIDAADLPRLFERFYRVRDAQSRTHEGSGIGLALVKELVNLHHGSIVAESTPGSGSTFRVTLPKGCEHLPPDQIGQPRRQTSTAITADHFVKEALRWLPDPPAHHFADTLEITSDMRMPRLNARVLIVDDNADMRDYLKRLVGDYYQVETAADGLKALAMAQAEPPDLILSDVMLPGLDGYALVRELRQHPATQSLPIILLSARVGEEAYVEGLRAGANDYLVKPFSTRELLARIGANLQLDAVKSESLLKERQYIERIKKVAGAFIDITATLTEAEVLQLATARAQAIIGTHQAISSLITGRNWAQAVNCVLLSDKYAAWRDYQALPNGSGIYAQVCETNTPMRLTQAALESHPRWHGFGQEAPHHPPLNGWLAAPLISRDGKNMGIIQLSDKIEGDFTEEDEAILVQFAQLAAVALQNASLHKQSMTLSVMEERQRLARDLHDAVSQSLFSSTVMAESLPHLWERNPQRAFEILGKVILLNRAAMAEMRTLLLELRPEAIINNPLEFLLNQLIEAVQGRRHIEAEVVIEEESGALPPEVHVAVYRIAQEALNNIVKHSQATALTLHLHKQAQHVVLRVRDNGRGFEVAKLQGGIGLYSMRERAMLINAQLSIESEPGAGAAIRLEWHSGRGEG